MFVTIRHNTRLSAAVFLLLTSSLATASAASDRIVPSDASLITRRVLTEIHSANRVPGMSAAIWRDGEIAWHDEVGFRNVKTGEKVTHDTLFRFASVSKIFAFVAAAKLKEQGLLDIDQPVRSMLPALAPSWSDITARQLATHTSGIPHYQLIDAGRGTTRFTTTDDAIKTFSDRALLSTPGSAYFYSTYGYTLLSGVVEKQAQMPYLDYLAKEVVHGLKIVPDMAEKNDANMSQAYQISDQGASLAPAHDYSYSWGGAGLAGTAIDLARFGGRLLDHQVLSKSTFAWMQEPSMLANGKPITERDFVLGFGWRLGFDNEAKPVMHHAGVTIGARSVLVLYPQERFAVSLLSNASWVSSIEQTALTLSAAFRKTEHTAPKTSCPVLAISYEGQFMEEKIQGSATFSLQEGMCVASLALDNAFGTWLGTPIKEKIQAIKLIGLSAQGDFSRAAMVTPVGAYLLKMRDQENTYDVKFNATRSLSLRFVE